MIFLLNFREIRVSCYQPGYTLNATIVVTCREQMEHFSCAGTSESGMSDFARRTAGNLFKWPRRRLFGFFSCSEAVAGLKFFSFCMLFVQEVFFGFLANWKLISGFSSSDLRNVYVIIGIFNQGCLRLTLNLSACRYCHHSC